MDEKARLGARENFPLDLSSAILLLFVSNALICVPMRLKVRGNMLETGTSPSVDIMVIVQCQKHRCNFFHTTVPTTRLSSPASLHLKVLSLGSLMVEQKQQTKFHLVKKTMTCFCFLFTFSAMIAGVFTSLPAPTVTRLTSGAVNPLFKIQCKVFAKHRTEL